VQRLWKDIYNLPPSFRTAGFTMGPAVRRRRCLPHSADLEARMLFSFAVGTRVTSRPPHRSVRAQFGHTAPTLGV